MPRRSIQVLARKTPAFLRRFIKRALVPEAFILWLYPSLRRPSASHKKRKKKKPKPHPPLKRPSQAKMLSRAMNSGFGAAAAKKLEDIILDRQQPAREMAEAAWALALWHRFTGEHDRALDHLIMRRLALPQIASDKLQLVVESDTLIKLGRVNEASALIAEGIARLGEIPELCYCAANAVTLRDDLPQSERDRLRLEWINKPFLAGGFAPVRIKDASRPLALDNITASTEPHPRSAEAKISVLMPIYNAAETVAVAIEAVLAQNWVNLELIVVDDGSSDDSWTIIQAYAARDSRVVPLRHETNRGAYAARNTALGAATGDLVTTHDSDDWSHPEQMAVQASHLLDSGIALNTTASLRTGFDLHIVVKPRDGAILVEAYVSLLTRTEFVRELGGWDDVRMGADSELYDRLLLRHRQDKVRLLRSLPLAFHLRREQSLTAQAHIGISTIGYGARRQYFEASRYWQRSITDGNETELVLPATGRRYPVPNICRRRPSAPLKFDILFVSDFSLPGGTCADNVSLLEASRALGLECGCFHWPRLDRSGRDFDPRLRKLLHEEIAESAVAGERVLCELVIVNHPALLNQLPDTRVEVKTKACVIIADQAPRWRTGGGRYEAPQVLDNARAAFGVEPTIAPVTPSLRRLLGQAGPGITMTRADWTPILDAEQWRPVNSSWDGSRRPILGRHSRDHPDKWPANRQLLRHAYCADTDVEVRIIGGAEHAKTVMGNIPANWTVHPFDSVDVRSGVGELDFFVHYPNERCIDAFPRAAIEAMAAGVLVILPPVFQESFFDGAIYSEPASVLHCIYKLWSDRETYEAQLRRGYNFIERNCSYARFEQRVRPYLN